MKLIHFLFLFILVIKLNAQTNINQYFDDNNISISKNVIKFNLTSLYFKSAELSLERVISNSISVEVSFARYFGFQPQFPQNFEQYSDIPDWDINKYKIKNGREIKVGLKYFPFGFPTDGYYVEAKHTWGNFSNSNSEFSVKNIDLASGYELDLFTRVSLDLYSGIGFYYDSREFSELVYNNMAVYLQVGIKVGYSF